MMTTYYFPFITFGLGVLFGSFIQWFMTKPIDYYEGYTESDNARDMGEK